MLTKNNYANFTAMAGDMFAQGKPITDEQVFVYRQQVVNAGMANGLDPASAGIIADEIINSYGLKDGTAALKAFYKDSTEMMEAGNKFVLASATQRMLSMQEASWIMALPEPLQNHVLTKNFGKVNNMLVNYLGGVKTNSTTGEYELADVNSLTEEDLVTVGHVAKNMNSSAMYNNAVRSRAEAMFLSRFNIAQNLTATSSDADAQTVAMNVDGALKFVNLDLAAQHANEMKNSNDPTEAEIGALLEQEVNKTVQQKDLSQKIPVARRIAKDMVNLNKNPELSRATNSVFKSSNVNALRFTEDGELFVSRLADESAIDLFAGAGTEDLKAVNDYLKGLDPEMRKLVLQQKGVQAAEAGDAPYIVDTSKSLTENLLDASSTPEEIAQRAETKRVENEKMSAIEAEYKGKIKTGDYWEKRRQARAASLGEPYDLLDLPKDIANGIKSLFGVKDAKAQSEEIAKLQETLKDDNLKPHIRRAVEGTIKVLEGNTATASVKSSETLANAKVVMAGDEGEAESYKNVPDERVAEKEELNAKVKALKEALDKTDDVYDREYLKDAIQHYGRELQMLETGEQHSRASVSSSTPLAFAKLSGEAKTNEQIWEEHANKHSEERNLNKAQTRNYKELWGKLEKDIRKMREENPATLFHVEPKFLEERFLNILMDKGSDAAYKHLRSWKRLIEEAKKWNDGDDVQVYLNNEGELVIGTVKPKGPNAVKGE